MEQDRGTGLIRGMGQERRRVCLLFYSHILFLQPRAQEECHEGQLGEGGGQIHKKS